MQRPSSLSDTNSPSGRWNSLDLENNATPRNGVLESADRRRQFLLPPTQHAAGDAIAARDPGNACIGLRRIAPQLRHYYSITSSARPTRVSGNVRLSALAALS